MLNKLRRWIINYQISVNQKDIVDLQKLLVDHHDWLSEFDKSEISWDIKGARANIKTLKNKLRAL